MKTYGFTIVEVVIVITIMGILLGLGVVGVRSSEQNARDNERRVDIENIATALENGRTSNNGPSSAPSYPTVSDMQSFIAGSPSYNMLPDIDPRSVRSPGNDSQATPSIVVATNGTTTPTGVRPIPTIDTYVYQPMSAATTRCTVAPCRSFNLFYRLEGDAQIQLLRSRHQ